MGVHLAAQHKPSGPTYEWPSEHMELFQQVYIINPGPRVPRYSFCRPISQYI